MMIKPLIVFEIVFVLGIAAFLLGIAMLDYRLSLIVGGPIVSATALYSYIYWKNEGEK